MNIANTVTIGRKISAVTNIGELFEALAVGWTPDGFKDAKASPFFNPPTSSIAQDPILTHRRPVLGIQ